MCLLSSGWLYFVVVPAVGVQWQDFFFCLFWQFAPSVAFVINFVINRRLLCSLWVGLPSAWPTTMVGLQEYWDGQLICSSSWTVLKHWAWMLTGRKEPHGTVSCRHLPVWADMEPRKLGESPHTCQVAKSEAATGPKSMHREES